MWVVTTPSKDVEGALTYNVPLGHNATKMDVMLNASAQHIAAQAAGDFSSKADVEWRSDRVTELGEGVSKHLGQSATYDIMSSEGGGVWVKFKAKDATKANRSYTKLDLAEKALEGIASEYPGLMFRIEVSSVSKYVAKVALNGKTYVHEAPKPVQTEIPVKADEAKTPELVKAETPAKVETPAAKVVAKPVGKR